MKKTNLFLISLILILGCKEPDENGAIQKSSIVIENEIINEDFGGIGFHVFYHSHNPPRWHYEQIFAKRWRELNPSFARITDFPGWDKTSIDKIAQNLEVMKDTDTELYFTTWGTRVINNYENELDYVKKEVDNLEYFKVSKGFDNLNYYCMTNELSLEGWASLVKNDELDRFKSVHQLFYDEFKNRNLDIRLLATDASPFTYWHTIEWAAENMDEITGVYGGHHYINSYDLFDLSFYPFFLGKMQWGANIARSKNKHFIVGEFGPKQNSNIIDSVNHDACIYNNTPLERYVGIQVAEAIMAMINGGIYASSYWTFSDFPSGYRPRYINKWGVFKWEIDDFTTRPSYYALGLLTKFFRGPAQVYKINASDSLLRVCGIRNLEDQTISVAIVNRNPNKQSIDLEAGFAEEDVALRKYVYDPENVPFNYFGDLQPPEKKVILKNGKFRDVISPSSLVVYTSKFDEKPPAPVKGFRVENKNIDGRNRNVLTWEPNMEDDFCYYRIYRSEKENVETMPLKQFATTISTEYIDIRVHGLPQYYYKVIAVDNSGNSSE